MYYTESMYRVFEDKLQTFPLTNLNKYLYNDKSEIKVNKYKSSEYLVNHLVS
jgi:hypothetical protein